MTISITSLLQAHLDDAARLVAEGAARGGFPFTDEGLEGAVRKALGRMDLSSGVVALRDGGVAGFLVGFSATLFNGLPGVFAPEWGHATDGDATLYGPMYRAASERWVAEGRTTHALSLFSGDTGGLDSWFGMDFGRHLVDGARRVEPGSRSSSGIEVRPGTGADLDAAVIMERATAAHLNSAPVFLGHQPDDREALRLRLADPDRPVFVADTGDRVIGWVTASPAEETPLSIGRHVPLAIDGAYVDPAGRSAGIGASLVEAMMAWAASRGFEWVAVDYETANLEAAGFWPRCGFDPLLVSLARTIGIPAPAPAD